MSPSTNGAPRIESATQNPRQTYPFENLVPQWYQFVKRLCDVILGLVFSLLATPIVLFAGLLVKLTSRGPVIYSQTRVGRFGKPYTIYKIRTMQHLCENKSGPQWSVPGDTRVTFVGRILRRYHIDELPQLWNVLRGEMSLMGPRPERPEFTPRLEEKIPYYRLRLHVKPGITGLAQVRLPPDSDLESVRRKLAYDLYYVHRMNLWLDLRLLLCTALLMVGAPTRFSNWLLRIPGGQTVEAPYENATSEGLLPAEFQPAL